MSTLLREKNEKKGWGSTGAAGAAGGVQCGMCQGELYWGDRYFLLEGQKICEACLERYAQRRFAHRLCRVGRQEGGWGA
ncbi:MAG TPA: hypothetical protein IAC25_00200 [Candidatus Enterenecus stercoripullorum]|nr:hypothetical protein [Candidatus Enterenecus stercoripullorum]